MNFLDSAWLSTGLGLLLIVAVCYAMGRMHQWFKQTDDRDEAFKEGYDRATRSLFHMATRVRTVRPAPTEKIPPPARTITEIQSPALVPPPAQLPRGPRHRAGSKTKKFQPDSRQHLTQYRQAS